MIPYKGDKCYDRKCNFTLFVASQSHSFGRYKHVDECENVYITKMGLGLCN